MNANVSERINKAVVGYTWEDLSEIGTGIPYTGSKFHRDEPDAAYEHILSGKYDPKRHRLNKIIWDDGSESWASWSQGKDRLYINSACGSPMVTVYLN